MVCAGAGPDRGGAGAKAGADPHGPDRAEAQGAFHSVPAQLEMFAPRLGLQPLLSSYRRQVEVPQVQYEDPCPGLRLLPGGSHPRALNTPEN